MPDIMNGQTPPPSTPAPSAPSQPVQQTPPIQPTPQPTPSPQPTPGTLSPAAPVQTPFEARKYFSEKLGNPAILEQYENDEQFASQLLDVVRQYPNLHQQAQLAQRYAPHAAEFEAWRSEREAAAEAKKKTEGNAWWNPPAYDPSWEQAFDAQGNLKPGEDPSIPAKIRAFRDFQKNKLNDFFQDPMKALEPGLKGTLEPMIKSAIQESLRGYQETQQAHSYVTQNLNWLANKDSQGNPIRNQDGSWNLSPAGQLFQSYVKFFAEKGVKDVEMQRMMAERCTEGDILRANIKQNGQPSGPAPTPGGNRLAALGSPAHLAAVNGEFPAGTSLKDRLTKAMEENGITNQVFSNER